MYGNAFNTNARLRALENRPPLSTDLETQVAQLQQTVTELVSIGVQSTTVQTTAAITQIADNTDLTQSFDTWFNNPSVPGNQQLECGVVFTHAPDASVVVYDAVMNSGSPTIASSAAAFVPGDTGKNAIVQGAGVAGAALAGTLTYVSAAIATLSVNASTNVTGARMRFRCVKLGKTSAKSTGSTVTDSIKDPTHPNFGSNIQSPQWSKAEGIINWGGTNTVDCFLGFWDLSGNFFPQITPFAPGRSFWAFVFKMARKNKFIKPKGLFYAGLWNNSDNALEYMRSSTFTVRYPTIGLSTTSKFLFVAYTDTGLIYLSQIITLTDAPAESQYSDTVTIPFSWDPIPGIRSFEIYRKISSGNVFKLERITSGASAYIDNNNANRVDTGSTSFPTFPTSFTEVPCVAFTSDITLLPVVGEADWGKMAMNVPVTPVTSFAGVAELVMRFGFTSANAYEVPNCTLNGTTTITAPEGFLPALNGLTCVIRDTADNNRTFTAVATYVSATQISVPSSPGWSSSTNAIEFPYSELDAYKNDLFGVSTTNGAWAYGPHDRDRPQLQASNPTSSDQGGTDPGPFNPGGGGIDCFHENMVVTMFDGSKKLAGQIQAGDMVFYGSATHANRIKSVRKTLVYEYFRLTTQNHQKYADTTMTHRYVQNEADKKHGTALFDLKTQDLVLIYKENTDILDAVESIERIDCPQGEYVVTVELEDDATRESECHLLILNDFIMHNQKNVGNQQPGQDT